MPSKFHARKLYRDSGDLSEKLVKPNVQLHFDISYNRDNSRTPPNAIEPLLLKTDQPLPLPVRSLILLSASVSTISPFSPSFILPLRSRPSCKVPTSCPTVPSSTGLSSFPCRLKVSLCQLICPPSASLCFCAFRFAAWIEVRL